MKDPLKQHQEKPKPSLRAKFGLHCDGFAQLPTSIEYFQLKVHFAHTSNAFFTMDISAELAMLENMAGSELYITVPTLGFTDPTCDYALEPLFAVPVSINAFVSAPTNPGLSRAKVFATDIGGSIYPLLCCPSGKIDYQRIEEHVSSTDYFFTALEKITYVYTSSQLNQGLGLHQVPGISTQKCVEWLLPQCSSSFSIMLVVKDKEGRILRRREVKYADKSNELPTANLVATWESGPEGTLKIDYKAAFEKYDNRNRFTGVTFDVPMQEGVTYRWQERAFSCQPNANTLKITQYFALSTKAFTMVVKSIIPWSQFQQTFLMSHQKIKEGPLQRFNCYHECKDVLARLYDLLIQGVVNHSVPLFALSPFFAEIGILNAIAKWDLKLFDKHDQYLLKTLSRTLENNETSNFIDKVDELLALATGSLATTIILQNSATKWAPKPTVIRANLKWYGGDDESHQMPSETALQFAVAQVENPLQAVSVEPKIEQSDTYSVNLANLMNDKDPRWRANDKINVSELLNILEKTDQQAVLHVQITPEGDTEIWADHPTDVTPKPKHSHLATLKNEENEKSASEETNPFIGHKRQ